MPVTFLFFTLPPGDWQRGLLQMGTTPRHLCKVPGLRFARMLGTGIAYGLRPDLRHYGLLAEWTDATAAQAFLLTDPVLTAFAARGWTWITTWLEPLHAHGAWGGAQPFRPTTPPAAAPPDGPVAVLTRAAIRWSRLRAFWQAVPAAACAVAGAEGLRFSLGMGELPLVRQATLSIWESEAAMRAYAYRAPAHLDVMKRTRAEGWYSEELFARFRVVEAPQNVTQ